MSKSQNKKNLTIFLFIVKTMKQKSLSFGENSIIKNAFHKDEIQINIYEKDIKK